MASNNENEIVIIDNPLLLPTVIKIDIETMMEYEDMDVELIMDMIKGRVYSYVEIMFSIDDLSKYIEDIKQRRKNKINLPISPSDMVLYGNNMVRELDKSKTVDYKNHAQVLDYFKKKALERMKLLEDTQTNRKEIIIELEMMFMRYMDTAANIIEKQEKLKLNMRESNSYKPYIKEQIDKLFIVLKSVLKNNLDKELYKKIIEEMDRIMKLYKF
jgi:hypothetical protein